MIPFIAIGPAADYPAPADVELGVTYAFDSMTGGYVGAGVTPSGPLGGKLSVDYADDWQLVDGVEDAGYEFSPQREFDGATPAAPTDGVKIRRANPTKSDILMASALGVGLETTDLTFSLWSTTLRDASDELISPARGDFILADDGEYRILICTRTMDYAQWRCVCRRRASQVPI